MYGATMLYGAQRIPNEFCADQVDIFSFGDLTERETFALNVALKGVAKTIAETKDINARIKVTMLFVFKDQLILDFNFEKADGLCSRMAILPVHKWRKNDEGDAQMSFYIAEEICHMLMSIDDEDLIKTKVLEVLHRAMPNDVKGSFVLKEMPSVLPYYMLDER